MAFAGNCVKNGGKKSDRGVRAKKNLGQHFLHDKEIARRIAESVISESAVAAQKTPVLEIGSGTGILSCELWQRQDLDVKMIELDSQSVKFLLENYPQQTSGGRLIEGDFLHIPLTAFFNEKFIITGNFPYNISSQILFKAFENKDIVMQITGMFQKEVAERITSKPCNKSYGILSVLLQAYYNAEYLFTVQPEAFIPPPKVQSGVIRLMRNSREALPFPDRHFVTIVKTAFNQRRKVLRNALSTLIAAGVIKKLPDKFALKRAEQLSVEDFIEIACGNM
ncbi:MAG: 16S rRNA (adenine(1518)-N(6)/adenine(1519)-N(6))-dimethyltransferase RsmA [Bacteroidales bacterium]|jgi:16S rRNA (adenine1518-N6/adenine1519-N6)-dimethyltransferase|nr:16S rRNA (adenine(1518)-N(6)/adenine(1519)-N(6))-dimethyltransferase RsmA [Bacteroidales bacterium]